MSAPDPACEQCRGAAATQLLSYARQCGVVRKRLCDACARAVELPHPFTLQPLPRPS